MSLDRVATNGNNQEMPFIRNTQPDPTRPWWTSSEVAAYLDEPVEAVWRWAREGNGPIEPLRLGGRSIRWPTAKLLRALGIPLDDESSSEMEAS
jgi:hypothetical protein